MSSLWGLRAINHTQKLNVYRNRHIGKPSDALVLGLYIVGELVAVRASSSFIAACSLGLGV